METSKVTIKDYDTIMDFLCKDFIFNEPLCSGVCMTKDDFVQAFETLIKNCCESGLSYKTKTKDELIGVILSISYHDYINCATTKSSPKITFITNILEQLSIGYQPSEDSIYIFIVSSSSNDLYKNKGIAKHLINESIRKARDLGFNEFIVDATNMITQYIFGKHFGFKIIKDVVNFSTIAARMIYPPSLSLV